MHLLTNDRGWRVAEVKADVERFPLNRFEPLFRYVPIFVEPLGHHRAEHDCSGLSVEKAPFKVWPARQDCFQAFPSSAVATRLFSRGGILKNRVPGSRLITKRCQVQ